MRYATVLIDGQQFGDEAFGDLRNALKTFGISIYWDPRSEGSSDYGIILADTQLTAKQIKKLVREEQT
jgi:hypothetical protein